MSPPSSHQDTLQPYAASFGRSTENVLDDLENLCALLTKWQTIQNLVSRETLGAIWERHILDSLQLLPLIEPVVAGADREIGVVDIGSGGGFPALPLAIALKGRPVHLHLIESHGRKCAYLNAAVRAFNLPVTVHNARIEEVPAANLGSVDVVTSRALAAMPMLLSYVAGLWQPQTRAFLHKGREYGEELRQADSAWRHDVLSHSSRVDPQGVILEVRRLEEII